MKVFLVQKETDNSALEIVILSDNHVLIVTSISTDSVVKIFSNNGVIFR